MKHFPAENMKRPVGAWSACFASIIRHFFVLFFQVIQRQNTCLTSFTHKQFDQSEQIFRSAPPCLTGVRKCKGTEDLRQQNRVLIKPPYYFIKWGDFKSHSKNDFRCHSQRAVKGSLHLLPGLSRRSFMRRGKGNSRLSRRRYYERHKRSLIFYVWKQKMVCLLIKTDLC